ncbi:MAG: hypothetical protein MJA30_34575, partial [Cytophagales bacterium]|nr:hypothetical protein [Cytophagales bacterium]
MGEEKLLFGKQPDDHDNDPMPPTLREAVRDTPYKPPSPSPVVTENHANIDRKEEEGEDKRGAMPRSTAVEVTVADTDVRQQPANGDIAMTAAGIDTPLPKPSPQHSRRTRAIGRSEWEQRQPQRQLRPRRPPSPPSKPQGVIKNTKAARRARQKRATADGLCTASSPLRQQRR